ncbi:MAG: succinate dehydrogenase, partial [Clostridia bacterium]|nr:succinate dehydrogenase [Clostridia bacterium]
MKTTVTSNFFIRKLHSLLGVVPVGVFLVFHLVANSLANRGPESYNNMIAFLRSTPYLLWVE